MLYETTKYVDRNNVLVVDDGSTDSTLAKAKEHGVRTLSHAVNRGKSAALKGGFAYFIEHSQFDCAITIDGDLQHPPEFIPRIVDIANKGYDVVMGNRMDDVTDMPFHRRMSNWLSSWGISVVLHEKLPDTQCGFRLHRRWVVERLDLKSRFYAIETEVALQAGLMEAKFAHLPIPTIYNGSLSYIHPVKATLRITGMILGYFFRTLKGNTK